MTETTRIENKRELNKEVDIEKEVIAFLNYKEGGFIYIGVDKDGKNIGVTDLDGDMLKIKDRIRNNISPSAMGLFDVTEETRKEKNIIKITVASGSEKPYFKKKYGMTEKGCYLRVGTAAEPMPPLIIDRLFATRTRYSIGKIKSNRQDLSFEQLRIYYEEHQKILGANFKRSLELITDENKYNYVAYLLADENNVSIKVAKYSSLDRVDLIESNEYGNCSLIKATKNVLDKIDLENKTATKITHKERIDTPLWDRVALREAIINAMVHNDYSFEISPKFEIFPDRFEITSAGVLPYMMSQEEFFEGISIPRNKELMRVFRDVELVEYLGSGVPRILRAYGRECFRFMDNFTRMIFPVMENQEWNEEVIQDVVVSIGSSEGNIGSSENNIGSSEGNIGSSKGNNIGSSKRISKKELETLIIENAEDYLFIDELAKKVGRTMHYLKNFIIPQMLQDGKLQRLYPNTPKHPRQKYKRK